MNNFTYENTKYATHLFSGTQMLKVDGDRYRYMNKITNFEWEFGGKVGKLLNSIIELSRPHNETRDHWTTNGVTQYAQGNKMNTDEMIHIDFSRNITPFVVRDKLYNAEADLHFEINCKWQLKAFNNYDEKDKDKYFVVSFADRTNTGTQPVGDDVVVNMQHDADSFPAYFVMWAQRKGELWKPNKEAMLKQYQAEQALQKLNEGDVIMVNSRDELLDAIIAKAKETPVFTQAMSDNHIPPPIGSMFKVGKVEKDSRIIDFLEAEVEVIGLCSYEDGQTIITFKHPTSGIGCGAYYSRWVKPIQTDEDKVVNALRELLESLNVDSAAVSEALTDLMSDKFTITLNKSNDT